MRHTHKDRMGWLAVILLTLLSSAGASAAAEDENCAAIRDDADRLACYDALGKDQQAASSSTFLEQHWDLSDSARGGTFKPRAHQPVYMLPARWSSHPNEEPFETLIRDPDVQSVETKFQISFKTKVVEGLLGGPGNLWFAYTQQSHFQIYNASESRPFRETDFEPEAILTFPLRRNIGSWNWRMLGVGVVHQSNGRSEPVSRSWNRIYALAGIERKNIAIHIKPWIRFDSTDLDDDDNPDIEDFVGRLETTLQWNKNEHVLTLRGRSSLNFDGHRGSIQGDWFFPIRPSLRGQLQVFHGYGESLIDFDHRQTAVGVGILLFNPFGNK